jgi:hypothetical protein
MCADAEDEESMEKDTKHMEYNEIEGAAAPSFILLRHDIV